MVHASSVLAMLSGVENVDARSRDWLLSQLQEYVSDYPAHRTTVFFDEQITYTRVTVGVEERATDSPNATATLILDTIRALPTPERSHCTVVTADEHLAAGAVAIGAQTQDAHWLLTLFTRRHLETPAPNEASQPESAT